MGSVTCQRASFELVNQARQENGEPEFANPRNAAAGTLRQLDTAVVPSAILRLFSIKKQALLLVIAKKKVLKHLEQLGFVVNPKRILAEAWMRYGILSKK